MGQALYTSTDFALLPRVDRLHALPISFCGLRSDDDAVRVAMGLRLGVRLCAPDPCPCGVNVDSEGTHTNGLACRRSADRTTQ